ncbi:MAG: FAD-binding oxidoreductase [Dehalococcoidia bacterium]|nr:FAD-binding oxidoreductase [Dehalococcoidia bacterium]
MSDFATRSFWLGRRPYQPAPSLEGDATADIVIVGGGFTGLWSAIHLKDADPGLDIVLLEQQVIGYGASGRNGGFAMTMVERNIAQLLRRVGPEQARAQHLAMIDALREIETVARQEALDADITDTGLLTVSNGPEQDIRIRKDLEAAERLGLDDFHELDRAACQDLVRTDKVRCGHWEDNALLVDPAALARGLKDAAQRRGVRIFEQTHVDAIEGRAGRVEARTPSGTVTAQRGLIATNAYAHSIPALRKYLFTIYAYITLTEPLSDEQWARVGWERRMGIEDKRIMPHFHRPTADGRILWGGRDALFSPEGPNPARDRDDRIFGRLEETFRWTFPQLDDVNMEHGWAGPVCGTINCMATVRWLEGGRLLYALGYSGHGVGPSQLAGKMVRDLLLDRKTELLELPMVTLKPARLPPGPLRAVVLNTAQHLLMKADDTGGRGGGPLVKLALRVLQ